MTWRRRRWRPLRDATWVLVAITTASMIVSLHLGNLLYWPSNVNTMKTEQSPIHSANHAISIRAHTIRSPGNAISISTASVTQHDILAEKESQHFLQSKTGPGRHFDKPGSHFDHSGSGHVNNSRFFSRGETIPRLFLETIRGELDWRLVQSGLKQNTTNGAEKALQKTAVSRGYMDALEIENTYGQRKHTKTIFNAAITQDFDAKSDLENNQILQSSKSKVKYTNQRIAENSIASPEVQDIESLQVRFKLFEHSGNFQSFENEGKEIVSGKGTGYSVYPKPHETPFSSIFKTKIKSRPEDRSSRPITEKKDSTNDISSTLSISDAELYRNTKQVSNDGLLHSRGDEMTGPKDGADTISIDNNGEVMASSQDLQRLFNYLRQVEAESVPSQADKSKVLTVGPLASIKHHLPLIEAAFHKAKADVGYIATDGPSTEGLTDGQTNAVPDNWSILICLNSTSMAEDCVVTAGTWKQACYPRKVNVIPDLTTLLASPNLLCKRDPPSNKEPMSGDLNADQGRWLGGDLPCHKIDTHGQDSHGDFFKSVDVHSRHAWMVANDGSGVESWLQSYENTGTVLETQTPRTPNTMVVPILPGFLNISGSMPFVWQVNVLVSSLKPHRFYLHSNGIFWESLLDFSTKKHHRNLSLEELHELMASLGSQNSIFSLLIGFKDILLRTLHLAESSNGHDYLLKQSSLKGFQMLKAAFLFDSLFRPKLLQLHPISYSAPVSSLSDYLLEQNALDDLALMMTSQELVNKEVFKVLAAIGYTMPQKGQICHTTLNTHCLNQEEILYLLDTRREQNSNRNWKKLYPSRLTSSVGSTTSFAQFINSTPSRTRQIELVAEFMEYYISNPNSSAFNIPGIHQRLGPFNPSSKLLNDQLDKVLKSCSEDPSSVPHLAFIDFRPPLQLYPEFSPLTTDYQAEVDDTTFLLQVRTQAKHCKGLAWLEDMKHYNSWENFTLGIGDNVAHVLVGHGDRYNPSAVNTYRITIHRPSSRPGGQLTGHSIAQMKTCAIRQHCDLPYSQNEPCGLKAVTALPTWNAYQSYHQSLPLCQNTVSNDFGQWIVPCQNCQVSDTCHWNKAIWLSGLCREHRRSTQELQKCFSGKKALFIGDSTNRGVFHYVIERLNGSLLEWDKTHKMQIYPNINNNRTVFGFAYYPQFWLPINQRPGFEKALARLLKRMEPLSNSSDTVIVIGGVHWLAKHHLDLLMEELRRSGLSGAHIVLKGLGAGFHQPVSGIHRLSLKEHHRLLLQNQATLSYGAMHGMRTVDTFNMTMARYTEFLPGKCACHFHKVTETRRPILSKLNSSTGSTSQQTTYRVVGDINQAYSETVINEICEDLL